MPTLPTRSHLQRLAALEEGNRIRSYRKEVKNHLRAGDGCLLDYRNDPDMQTARIMEFLLVTPRLGRVKSDQIIRRVRISPSKTFRSMTDRQWAALAAAMQASPAWATIHHPERQAA